MRKGLAPQKTTFFKFMKLISEKNLESALQNYIPGWMDGWMDGVK